MSLSSKPSGLAPQIHDRTIGVAVMTRFVARLTRGAVLFGAMIVSDSVAGELLPESKRPDSTKTIPWSDIGTAAGAQYSGDGLTVTRTEQGARLRCVFQRLDGEATPEGLWLTSTVTNHAKDRFRVTAVAVGENALAAQGEITVEGQLVRFSRPGLREEYSVSMDGVRQDFVVLEKPALRSQPSTLNSPRELRVELAVTGASVEQTRHGAQLVLASGRKIAYSRLRVTDANGKEFKARIEVPSSGPLQAALTSMVVVVDVPNAVYPIRIDPTFSDANWISMGGVPGVEADGGVSAAVVDGSGNLYIGGYFSVVGDVVANHIARWNGSSWSALGSGMSGALPGNNSKVTALAVSGGGLYAAGGFTMAGGVVVNHIAKWNGSSWSALGSGLIGDDPGLGPVYALAVSGDNLFAGGNFISAGGVAARSIAKWDGSSWSALGLGVERADGYVAAISELAVSGNDLYAGGFFTMAGGTPATNVARWNGSNWAGLGFGSGGVSALVVDGTNLYVGGSFSTAGGNPANRIAKWNGSSWSALGSGMNDTVFVLAVSGGELYAGGRFTTAGAIGANHIAKWNGNSWSALGSGMNDTVGVLVVSGGELYAGGSFTTGGGISASHIAKWNGSRWSGLGSGVNERMLAFAVSGGDVYVGGRFASVGGIAANRIAKWDGTGWSSLGSGLGGADAEVSAIAVSGTDLYAGGHFATAGGSPANNIAKWDGNNWSRLGPALDPGITAPFSAPYNGGSVYALAVLGADLYAGGQFTRAGGLPVSQIAKWNGSSWSGVGSGIGGGGYVYALAAEGSNLYAGGSFLSAGGSQATCIAKWNGSNWNALGSGMNGRVYALAVSGSNLYAGGWFTIAGGVAATNVAKWDGSNWSALGTGVGEDSFTPSVYALAVSGDDLFAAGNFTTVGGIAVNRIAKWDGNGWSSLGSGLGASDPANFASVFALAVSGSDVFAGGSFTTAGGKVSPYIARAVMGDPPGYNQLTGAPSSGGAMQFAYIGYPATNYALDRTFDLSPPVGWVGQKTNTMTVSGVLMFTNTPVAGTNNFWRVRSVP